MSVNPKYYYNLSGNITDGKKEYSLYHKEDKIGGLSISSDLKENYIEYGTNSLLDLLNKLNNENQDNKVMIEFLDTENTQIMNELKMRTQIQHQLEEENKELKAFKEKVFEWIDGEIDSVKESCNILMTSDEAEAVMDILIELKNELSGEKND